MTRSAGPDVGIHGRAAELARIGGFLDEVASHPAALLIEGEAGIGKTTLWSAGIDRARHRGSPHTNAGPLHTFSSPAHSAYADTCAP